MSTELMLKHQSCNSNFYLLRHSALVDLLASLSQLNSYFSELPIKFVSSGCSDGPLYFKAIVVTVVGLALQLK